MVKLPPKHSDPVVRAIFAAYERDAEDPRRAHLGASQIGKACERALWYSFRWAQLTKHEGRLLALFARGDREEPRLVADLRRIGVEVQDVDPFTNGQMRVSWLGGHFGGSCDGVIQRGVPGHESEEMVLELKTINDRNHKLLVKKGVKEVRPEHFAQMQVYMDGFELKRALYLSVNKNTDELYSEIVEYDETEATKLLERAERIVFSDEAPERIADDPKAFDCKFCDYRPICHLGMEDALQRNCRTCLSATAKRDGTWFCEKHGTTLPDDIQREGCPDHLFLPDLLPWDQVDANDAGRWVLYRDADGREILDRNERLTT